MQLLREKKEKLFYFPWPNDGSFVYSKFWESLLGSASLDLVGCLIQPEEADWAIDGPFFNTFMLGNKLLCCYADGVTYGVPWFAQSVEKVYFPINAMYIGYLHNSIFVHVSSLFMTAYFRKVMLKIENGGWPGDNVMHIKFQSYCYRLRIWVMRNLYRLVNNLSLDVSNPTQAGLAYREQLTDFFWKYKIVNK
ncbi:hypothetical protein Tco_0851490 [Tanacetum coccineum]